MDGYVTHRTTWIAGDRVIFNIDGKDVLQTFADGAVWDPIAKGHGGTLKNQVSVNGIVCSWPRLIPFLERTNGGFDPIYMGC